MKLSKFIVAILLVNIVVTESINYNIKVTKNFTCKSSFKDVLFTVSGSDKDENWWILAGPYDLLTVQVFNNTGCWITTNGDTRVSRSDDKRNTNDFVIPDMLLENISCDPWYSSAPIIPSGKYPEF